MTNIQKYDVLVIGSGNAGMAASSVLRAAGKSVGIIEKGDVGGVCAVRGCVPKKVLVAASQVLHQIDLAATHHIHVGNVSLDWPALIGRKRDFVRHAPDQFEESLANSGADLIRGEARFIGPRAIEVGDTTYHAEKIIVATGSKPRELTFDGAGHLKTSDDVLELDELPGTIVFIGGGVVALEFAHVLARAGTKVSILEVADRILPQVDEDLAAILHQETEALGIDIRTGVRVEKISRHGDCCYTSFSQNGESLGVSSEIVVNGAGRVADLSALDLERAGIEMFKGRPIVTPHLSSASNPDVYFAGDANPGTPQLSPVATYDGRLIANNILTGRETSADYSVVPANIYTTPALATVGLTEQQAADAGIDFVVRKNDLSGWRSSQTHAETASASKVLVGMNDGLIKGAHIFGHGAEEIIHLFAFAMKYGLTAEDLKAGPYAYPTWSSDIKFMV